MRIGEGRLKRHRDEMGEDVNPSAYIVNLADCMLVLACGFMVAMMVKGDISSQVEKVNLDDMKEVTPSEAPEDLSAAGSGYIEAGKVYVDPETGAYYIIKRDETGEEALSSEGGGATGEESSGSGGSASAEVESGSASGSDGASDSGSSSSGSASSGSSSSSGGTSSGGGSSTAGMFGM